MASSGLCRPRPTCDAAGKGTLFALRGGGTDGEGRWMMDTYLSLGLAGPARLELAILALVDEGMRARMAQIAIPLDEVGVGLDHLELVLAVCRGGHGDGDGDADQTEDVQVQVR